MPDRLLRLRNCEIDAWVHYFQLAWLIVAWLEKFCVSSSTLNVIQSHWRTENLCWPRLPTRPNELLCLCFFFFCFFFFIIASCCIVPIPILLTSALSPWDHASAVSVCRAMKAESAEALPPPTHRAVFAVYCKKKKSVIIELVAGPDCTKYDTALPQQPLKHTADRMILLFC